MPPLDSPTTVVLAAAATEAFEATTPSLSKDLSETLSTNVASFARPEGAAAEAIAETPSLSNHDPVDILSLTDDAAASSISAVDGGGAIVTGAATETIEASPVLSNDPVDILSTDIASLCPAGAIVTGAQAEAFEATPSLSKDPADIISTEAASFDEIEAVRIRCEDDDCKNAILMGYESPAVEMLMPGTEERNEQEEFQLQMGHEYFEQGLDYWTNSDLENAMREFARSLEIREDICGRKDSETAKCYLWVGTIHFLQDEFDRALDDFCRCFRIQYELTGNDMSVCHIVYNWINKSLEAKGIKDADEKDVYWKKFMTCIEQEQKGDALKESGKYDRAIEAYRTALQFEYLRRHLNPTTTGRPLADCGDLYYKIARCHEIDGKLDRAMMEYRQAFCVFLAKFGPNHRHTHKAMDKMVDVCMAMGFQESVAEEYIEQLPKCIRHEQAGDWMLESKKDPKGALKEYQSALDVECCYIGRTQVACAELYFKMGKAYQKLKQPHQALLCWYRAVGTFESILGAQHKDTTAAMKLIKKTLQQNNSEKQQRTTVPT